MDDLLVGFEAKRIARLSVFVVLAFAILTTLGYSSSVTQHLSAQSPVLQAGAGSQGFIGQLIQDISNLFRGSQPKSSATPFTVPALAVSMSIAPSSVIPNQSVTISVSWTGGASPYNVTLYSNEADSCSGSSSEGSGYTTGPATYYGTPTYPGTYYCAVVADSSGKTATAGPVYIAVIRGSTSTTTSKTTTLSTSSATTTAPQYTVAISEIPTVAANTWGACFIVVGYRQVCTGPGYGATASGTYPSGSTINSICTEIWDKPTSFAFSSWSGSYTSTNQCSISLSIPITSNFDIVADYVAPTTTTLTSTSTTSTSTKTTTVTTTVPPYENLSISNTANMPNDTTPRTGHYTYTKGSVVPINAVRCPLSCAEGYIFSNWTGTGPGSYTGTNSSAIITMNSNINEIAKYYFIPPTTTTKTTTTVTTTISTTVPPYENLSISNTANMPNDTTPRTGHYTYTKGSVVPINAVRCPLSCAEGYIFSNWTGTGPGSYTGTNSSAIITMNSNINEIAKYYFIPPTTTTKTTTVTTKTTTSSITTTYVPPPTTTTKTTTVVLTTVPSTLTIVTTVTPATVRQN